MLTEDQLKVIPDPIQDIFIKLERDAVAVICEHIRRIGELSQADIYKLNELRNVGFSLREIRDNISDTISRSRDDIDKIFAQATRKEYESQRLNTTPFKSNSQLVELISSISEATHGDIANMSRTIGFIDTKGRWQELAAYYQNTIDYAILQIRTGQTDFNSAMSSTIRNIADNGLTYVDYASGYRRRLDSSVRSALLGGQAGLSKAAARLTGEQFGADGMEITWHSGFRPTHWFGGQQFTMRRFNNEIEPRLEDPNCYHRAFPIILGVSSPTYSNDQLRTLNAKETVTKPFRGNEYNKYEQTQAQRQMETAIRREKDRINAFAASGDKASEDKARGRLAGLNEQYTKFSKAVGLSKKPENTRVSGFKR